jgi:hypothetical protein
MTAARLSPWSRAFRQVTVGLQPVTGGFRPVTPDE